MEGVSWASQRGMVGLAGVVRRLAGTLAPPGFLGRSPVGDERTCGNAENVFAKVRYLWEKEV